MTLRIDSDLKTSAEAFADAQGISLTELVQRSLRSFTTPICPTCGRSTASNVVAPGFSEGFDRFLEQIIKSGGNSPFVLLAEQGGEHVAYWVKLYLPSRQDATANAGVVMVSVLGDPLGRKTYTIPIARGHLVGWRSDEEGRWFQTCRDLGWLDGNTRVANQLGGIELGRPRRGDR